MKSALMKPLNLTFIQETGMAEYFKSHIVMFGVETEALCFTIYHCGQWGLLKHRCGERIR